MLFCSSSKYSLLKGYNLEVIIFFLQEFMVVFLIHKNIHSVIQCSFYMGSGTSLYQLRLTGLIIPVTCPSLEKLSCLLPGGCRTRLLSYQDIKILELVACKPVADVDTKS